MGETAIKVFMGLAFLMVGVGVGYMMYLQPEGLNAEWGIWVAELAPLMFALGGIYLISDALGYPRFALRLLQALLVCMLVLLHWIAFFVTDAQCSASISFLGIPIMGGQTDASVCRFALLMFVGTIDAIVIIPAAMRGWRQWRESCDGSTAK